MNFKEKVFIQAIRISFYHLMWSIEILYLNHLSIEVSHLL